MYEVGEEAEQEANRKARLKQQAEDADLVWLMELPQGRRVMWRLLGIAGLYRNPMLGDGDALTNFRCGKQAVGQELVANVHRLCPGYYFEMVKEQQHSDDAGASNSLER